MQDFNRPYLISGACQTSRVCKHYFVHSPRSRTPAEPAVFSHTEPVLLPATMRKVSASALYNLRGCIASRFRIAALVLHCLRLNLTSRLRLQGCVTAACWALPDADFHRTVLFAPNRRTFIFFIIAFFHRTVKEDIIIFTAISTVCPFLKS